MKNALASAIVLSFILGCASTGTSTGIYNTPAPKSLQESKLFLSDSIINAHAKDFHTLARLWIEPHRVQHHFFFSNISFGGNLDDLNKAKVAIFDGFKRFCLKNNWQVEVKKLDHGPDNFYCKKTDGSHSEEEFWISTNPNGHAIRIAASSPFVKEKENEISNSLQRRLNEKVSGKVEFSNGKVYSFSNFGSKDENHAVIVYLFSPDNLFNYYVPVQDVVEIEFYNQMSDSNIGFILNDGTIFNVSDQRIFRSLSPGGQYSMTTVKLDKSIIIYDEEYQASRKIDEIKDGKIKRIVIDKNIGKLTQSELLNKREVLFAALTSRPGMKEKIERNIKDEKESKIKNETRALELAKLQKERLLKEEKLFRMRAENVKIMSAPTSIGRIICTNGFIENDSTKERVPGQLQVYIDSSSPDGKKIKVLVGGYTLDKVIWTPNGSKNWFLGYGVDVNATGTPIWISPENWFFC